MQVGDVLQDGSIVQAVLQFPGKDQELYEFFGIHVSGLHKVWSYREEAYICIKDHPLSVQITETVPTLWSLITSSRVILAKGTYGTIRFADWEELPDTPKAAEVWDYIVRSQINSYSIQLNPIPTHPPCLDGTARVLRYNEGKDEPHVDYVQLSLIIAGDIILDGAAYTKVVGLCKRRVSGGLFIHSIRVTDGLWIEGDDGDWYHPQGVLDNNEWDGLQLVTESGTFTVLGQDTEDHIHVRDFTEVGISRLSNTYAMEDKMFPG